MGKGREKIQFKRRREIRQRDRERKKERSQTYGHVYAVSSVSSVSTCSLWPSIFEDIIMSYII